MSMIISNNCIPLIEVKIQNYWPTDFESTEIAFECFVNDYVRVTRQLAEYRNSEI